MCGQQNCEEENFRNVVKKFLVGQKVKEKGVRVTSVCGTCMCVQFFGHGQNLASNV